MDFRKTAGKRIKYYRKLCRMSQEELGDEVDLSCKHISTLENGEATMGIDTLMRLCHAFGVSPNDILLEPEERDLGSGGKRKLTQAEKLIIARMQLKELCYMLNDETEE
ncbi:MAG: helix-turn-helix transcriptional regulator [Firmicutes bacterium]|nr:helix-turn-helix transcriptional regulator [Bacillota bacterium]